MKRTAYRCRNIYTGQSAELLDGYLVTEGKKIVWIGMPEDVSGAIDRNTEIIDFSNNFIMPGFNDFHVHLIGAGLLEEDGILRYMKSEEEAAEYLYEFHKKDLHRKKWILGGAWDPLLWPKQKNPVKETLDRYFPDTPVFLLNKECHGAWVNSAALRFFNVTKHTKDPENGSYSRTENGEPDGYLHESAAMIMHEEIMKTFSDDEMAQYAGAFIKKANAYGITSLGDVAGGGPVRENAYEKLEGNGELTARISFYPAIEEGLDTIILKMMNFRSSLLKCSGAKAFIDGTPPGIFRIYDQ